MSNALYMSIVGGVFFLIIITIIYIALKQPVKASHSHGKKLAKKPAAAKGSRSAVAGLDDLMYLARSAQSREDLNRIVLNFLRSEALPDRRAGAKLSEDARRKLGFITTVCANKSADAKLITFLVLELEKRFPSYKTELEMYQNMGLAKRRMQR